MSTEPLQLELVIGDPEVLTWLSELEESERPAKAATALRIGVLALRQPVRRSLLTGSLSHDCSILYVVSGNVHLGVAS